MSDHSDWLDLALAEIDRVIWAHELESLAIADRAIARAEQRMRALVGQPPKEQTADNDRR